jgi:hypothetical protein
MSDVALSAFGTSLLLLVGTFSLESSRLLSVWIICLVLLVINAYNFHILLNTYRKLKNEAKNNEAPKAKLQVGPAIRKQAQNYYVTSQKGSAPSDDNYESVRDSKLDMYESISSPYYEENPFGGENIYDEPLDSNANVRRDRNYVQVKQF